MSPTFPLLENYCSYMIAALGRSELTVKEYKYDLILFARFMKLDRGKVPSDTPLEEIDISDIDVRFLNSVTTDDLLAFVIWLSRSRKQSNAARVGGEVVQIIGASLPPERWPEIKKQFNQIEGR